MNGKGPMIAIGAAITVIVHGALALGYVAYRDSQDLSIKARLGSAASTAREAPLMCGKLRCRHMEKRQKRRELEPAPIKELEILEAMVIPALGMVEPNSKILPELETYERPEFIEDGVNLEATPSKLDEALKDMEAKPELRDPKNKSKIADVLDNSDLDPRARPKDISSKTGVSTGDVNGQATTTQLGHAYSAKVTGEIKKVFKVPPFLDDATLKKLQVRVQVTRLSFDGSIEEYRIVSKSNERSYDDAALAAIKQFSSRDGGTKRFPPPDPEVLRFINTKGLTITLDGRLMRR